MLKGPVENEITANSLVFEIGEILNVSPTFKYEYGQRNKLFF